jgi:hypothetical protein
MNREQNFKERKYVHICENNDNSVLNELYLAIKDKKDVKITDSFGRAYDIYVKNIIKKITYTEITDPKKIAFETQFVFGLYFIVDEEKEEIIDSFMQPLSVFRLRTEHDKNYFNEICDEFGKDTDYFYDLYDFEKGDEA